MYTLPIPDPYPRPEKSETDLSSLRFGLRAGQFSMNYDHGDLRYIGAGDETAVNRVYAAVRDSHWGTVPGILTLEHKEVGADSFRIVHRSRHTDAEKGIDFEWRGAITGTSDSTIVYEFDGLAHTTFDRNRIGLCVLHPAFECAGRRCTIINPAGDTTETAFPRLIAPHQPFFDVASIRHLLYPRVDVEIAFDGDVFETEDQRNWIDASYKTYSTPLSLPYPVTIPAGKLVRQKVTVRMHGKMPEPETPTGFPIASVNLLMQSSGMPIETPVGLTLTADNLTQSEQFADRLAALDLNHLRIDVDVNDPQMDELLFRADALARKLAVSLYIGLHHDGLLPDDFLLPNLDSATLWYLFSPTAEAVGQMRLLVTKYVQIGGGSLENFTELNRNRPEDGLLDVLVYAANPQVHTTDELSIAETPSVLQFTHRTAYSFAGEARVHIGALTLYGKYAPEDIRQTTDFGAAWYRKCLETAQWIKAESVTLCETVGRRGVLSDDGTPYPIYEMLLRRKDQIKR